MDDETDPPVKNGATNPSRRTKRSLDPYGEDEGGKATPSSSKRQRPEERGSGGGAADPSASTLHETEAVTKDHLRGSASQLRETIRPSPAAESADTENGSASPPRVSLTATASSGSQPDETGRGVAPPQRTSSANGGTQPVTFMFGRSKLASPVAVPEPTPAQTIAEVRLKLP